MCIQFYLPFPHRQQLLLNSFFFINFSAYLFLEELAELFSVVIFGLQIFVKHTKTGNCKIVTKKHL